MPYKIKLKSKEDIASGTMAFHFEKPKDFVYKAGQFADYTLINPSQTDAEGNTRGFTIACAPYQDDIMFTTRMRDTAFKREMKAMPIGTEVTFDAPYGSFTLHNNTSIPAVFLTGGIGITPVRSILLQATHDGAPHQIFVFYSNKTPTDAAFLNELSALKEKNTNLTFVPSMTEMEGSDQEWNGERGFFTKEMLQKYIVDLQKPIYYLSGPKVMVSAVRKTINEAGVDDDNIRTEEFSGY
jgi:ferredoxin-NADP reductase